MGAQVLVEGNVFQNVAKPIVSESSVEKGYAVARNNDYGGKSNSAPAGTFSTSPYSYTLLPTSSVKSSVIENAGAKLSFS
jgi:pectate lyase